MDWGPLHVIHVIAIVLKRVQRTRILKENEIRRRKLRKGGWMSKCEDKNLYFDFWAARLARIRLVFFRLPCDGHLLAKGNLVAERLPGAALS